MGQTARFQETLRRLAMIDEGFVEDEAGLRLGQAGASALDPKTAALLQLGVSAAIGSPAVCLQWSTGRALAAGASEDEIAGSVPGRPALSIPTWANFVPSWGYKRSKNRRDGRI